MNVEMIVKTDDGQCYSIDHQISARELSDSVIGPEATFDRRCAMMVVILKSKIFHDEKPITKADPK